MENEDYFSEAASQRRAKEAWDASERRIQAENLAFSTAEELAKLKESLPDLIQASLFDFFDKGNLESLFQKWLVASK